MITRHNEKLLLRPEDLEATSPHMRVVSVFNPGAIDAEDGVVLVVRVVEMVAEQRRKQVGLPRWHEGDFQIDWLDRDAIEIIDSRVVKLKPMGDLRLTFTSHLRVLHLPRDLSITPEHIAKATPLRPQDQTEAYGIEDPRITSIDGVHYMTYVNVSRHGVCTSLMRTGDFVEFERLGVIFPPENKDVLLFPQKIDGRYVAMHRPNPDMHFHRPEIWLGYSDNLRDWGGHAPLRIPPFVEPGSQWNISRIGGGCPPVLTDRGWLVIYHGNARSADADSQDIGVYSAAALLLDRDDPSRVIAHTPEPIMTPQTAYETQGFVPNVVFPTALLDRGDRWLMIYGAADASTASVEFDKDELMDTMAEVST